MVRGGWRSPTLAIALPKDYFRLARYSRCRSAPQPVEPPDADPHVRWCNGESWRQPTFSLAIRVPATAGSFYFVACCFTVSTAKITTLHGGALATWMATSSVFIGHRSVPSL